MNLGTPKLQQTQKSANPFIQTQEKIKNNKTSKLQPKHI